MKKKKIVHLIQSLDNGGCENMLLRTLPSIEDFNHVLATLKNEGELAGKFRSKGFEIINIGQQNLFSPVYYFRLVKTIKEIDPDIIITYLFHADIIGRIIIQLFTKHNTIPFLRTTYNHKKYWIARMIEKLTKHFARHYLANSESVKNFYIDNIGVKKEKITVIPNGIDVNFYDNIPRDENFRKESGVSPDETAIICVANLHINKGHKYLLEAFEEIYKENQKIKLLLVGDGEEKENLQKQIENYQSKNNIIFLGKRTDVPQLLKISDIFVLPTLFEGMSNAIMEAMASSLPVITTDIPENKELIGDNKTGMLIPTKNSDLITRSIASLLDNADLRKNLGNNARKDIENKFDIEKIIQKTSTFYKSI